MISIMPWLFIPVKTHEFNDFILFADWSPIIPQPSRSASRQKIQPIQFRAQQLVSLGMGRQMSKEMTHNNKSRAQVLFRGYQSNTRHDR
jgi:hypothetical protein